MNADKRELHLNVNITGSGLHSGGWRSQDDPELFTSIDFFLEIARLAERGTFDAVFLADFSVVPQEPSAEPFQSLDNSALLGALATGTEHVGLVVTASTTYNDPFNIARRIATLDHVSRGRAALDLVRTYSKATAANYGWKEHPGHAARYGRADEFIDVVCKLWDSWEDDAIIGEHENDVFMAADRIHTIDHEGEHFSVRGPAVAPRSPQGRPVIARIAERGTFDAVFLADGPELPGSAVNQPWNSLEPTVLLTAIGSVVERIGLIGTISTTFNDPYNIARRFAAVDHVTHGRVALNFVTTQNPESAANFGLSTLPARPRHRGRV